MEHGQGTGEPLIKDEGMQVSGRIQKTTTLRQLLLLRDHLVLPFGFFCSPIKTNPHYSGLFVPSSVIITLSTFHIPTRQINLPWEGRRRVIERSGMNDAETETWAECKKPWRANPVIHPKRAELGTAWPREAKQGWHLQEDFSGMEQFPYLTGTTESPNPDDKLLYPKLQNILIQVAWAFAKG